MFLIASNFAESKSAIWAMVIGVCAADVAKVSWREDGGCSIDGEVCGDVGGVAIVLFLIQGELKRLQGRWLEPLRLRRRRRHRTTHQLLLLHRRLAKIRILITLIHIILIIRRASMHLILLPLITLQHTQTLLNRFITRLSTQRLDLRRPLTLSSYRNTLENTSDKIHPQSARIAKKPSLSKSRKQKAKIIMHPTRAKTSK